MRASESIGQALCDSHVVCTTADVPMNSLVGRRSLHNARTLGDEPLMTIG